MRSQGIHLLGWSRCDHCQLFDWQAQRLASAWVLHQNSTSAADGDRSEFARKWRRYHR